MRSIKEFPPPEGDAGMLTGRAATARAGAGGAAGRVTEWVTAWCALVALGAGDDADGEPVAGGAATDATVVGGAGEGAAGAAVAVSGAAAGTAAGSAATGGGAWTVAAGGGGCLASATARNPTTPTLASAASP